MPRIIRIIAFATALLLATAPKSTISTTSKPSVVIPGAPSPSTSTMATTLNDRS